MLEKFEGSDLSKEWQFKLNDFEKQDTESFSNDPLEGLNLYGEFNLNIEDFLPDTNPQGQSALPVTPQVSRQALATNNMPVSQTGLTQTEQGLLSEEEKGIRLRQRGMA